jgi:hypothetical protein
VDLYDFMLLEMLQVFFPAIYQDIWRNAWAYVPPWSADPMFSTPFYTADANEQYRRVRQHIEEHLAHASQPEIAKAILEEVFFVEVKNAFANGGHASHEGAAPMYRATQRLTHPECFPKYFLFRVPTGELSDQVVADHIRQWNQASESDTESLVGQTIRHYKSTGQLGELLVKLQTFVQRVSPARLRPIIRGLYQSAPFLSDEHELLGRSEIAHAELLALRLVEERAEPGDIGPVVEEIVQEVPSIPFAVLIVLSCHPGRGGRFYRIYEALDLHALRTVACQRLHAHYIEGHRDIFTELPENDWGVVLYQWGTNWMTSGGESGSAVQDYIFSLIDQRPAYLGLLLQHFIDKSFGNKEGPLRFEDFCQVYDPTAVLDRVHRYREQALTTPEAERAAKLFRQAHEERQEHTKNI